MRYIEITVEEAIKRCNKNTKVLVAIQDLANEDSNEVFIPKHQNEQGEIFSDVKTAASMSDVFIKQLRLFTEKQNIYDIRLRGLQKTVLLKE